VAERGITLTFASGALVDLLDEEASWLRNELVRCEYTSPKRDPSEGRNARRGGFCAVAASMLMSFPRTRSLRARFASV
jgi:hypothetical protein